MERLFKLKENGTTVRTEVMAGLTTFMTMAYIIALNPNLLTNFEVGALWNGVFMATCLASALAMFCMAFLANKPFALAPGMGLNSFFAVVTTNIVALTGMTYLESFQSALVIIRVPTPQTSILAPWVFKSRITYSSRSLLAKILALGYPASSSMTRAFLDR